MKALPLAVLVLLMFAAGSVSFLVAPLAVLTVFYVVYAVHSSRSEGAGPAPAPVATPARAALAGPEPEPPAAPVRRARITVAHHAGDAPAGDADPADGPSGTPPASPIRP